MSKPKLVIDQLTFRRAGPWNKTSIKILIDSGCFDISYEELPIKRLIGPGNNLCMSFLMLNEKIIALDIWDLAGPTSEYIKLYMKDQSIKRPDIIIKIQRSNDEKTPLWKELSNISGIKIIPWIVNPNSLFPIGFSHWSSTNKYKYLCFKTGRMTRKRAKWMKILNSPETPCYTKRLPYEGYLDLVKNSTWGLILKGVAGQHTDGKNRREYEYASCGIPQALDYQPYYPFPHEPNKHYVYLEKPEDVIKLKDIDPAPYAQASSELYEKYFSPVSAANLLIKLCE